MRVIYQKAPYGVRVVSNDGRIEFASALAKACKWCAAPIALAHAVEVRGGSRAMIEVEEWARENRLEVRDEGEDDCRLCGRCAMEGEAGDHREVTMRIRDGLGRAAEYLEAREAFVEKIWGKAEDKEKDVS